MEAETMTHGYTVGERHPTEEQRRIAPGDTVLVLAAWGARAYVEDVDRTRGTARVRTSAGVSLYARLSDLALVGDTP
jgi:hypothetical protein